MTSLYENEALNNTPFFDVFSEELSKMNDGQKAAVTHNLGPALCLAGPGSGKTRVISLRAIRLLAENESLKKGVVLTLAFNRPAGIEMRERGEMYCDKIWGSNKNSVLEKAKFVTIHAYCYEIAKLYLENDGRKIPKVISEEESVKFIEKSYLSITGKKSVSSDVLKRVKSYVRGEFVKRNKADVNPSQQEIIDKIGEDYKKYKAEYDLIDFHDMQEMAKLFLETDDKFREKIKNRFLFTQVDEAQDLSIEQLEIIKLISGENVFFVADDDQSIYGFRGANPKILKKVEETWNNTKTYLLNVNYRSNREIVDISSSFIKINSDRFNKKINSNRPMGGNVKVKTVFSVQSEAAFVSKRIIESVRKNRSICVLYRNNGSCILEISRLFLDSKKFSSKERIKLTPNIYGEGIKLLDFPLTEKVASEIRNIENDSNRFFIPKVSGSLSILENKRILDMIISTGGLSGRRPFFVESVKETLKLIGSKSEYAEDFWENINKIDRFRRTSEEKGLVSFSTVHSSKGLEFDEVIIVDCIKGEFPNGDVKNPEILREERRLMYVAMTRAKDNLLILRPLRCGRLYLEESMFIEEILEWDN